MRTSIPLPIVTARGVVLILAGAALILTGVFFSLPFSAIGFALACFLVALGVTLVREWFLVGRALRLISVDLTCPAALLSGKESTLDLQLIDTTRGPARITSVKARLEPLLEVSGGVEVSAGALDPRDTLLIPFQVTPLSRGKLVWEWVYLRVRRRGWALEWQVRAILDAPCRTVAIPNFLCAEDVPKTAALKQLTGERVSAGRLSEGREFDSLRPYAVGDDLRTVDWKRSARSHGLVVKTFRPETHQRLEILLDCSRRTSTRIGERLQLDYTVDAVSYLLRVAALNRDEVGLFAFNHTVVSRIPSNRSRRQERLVTDALIGLLPGQLEADYDLITAYGRSLSRRALLVLLTSVSNPTALEVIHRALGPLRSRHLPLVVSIADTALQTLAAQPADGPSDAFRIAAAQEQLEEIERKMRWLKSAGIECAYTDLASLPVVLAAKYEQVKRQGKL